MRAPSHAAQLESLGNERLARGFDDATADHESFALPLRIAHSALVLAEVGKDLRDLGEPRMFALQMRQCGDDGSGAVVFGEQVTTPAIRAASAWTYFSKSGASW